VDPVSGGVPVEQWDFECTGAGGHKSVGAGPAPNLVVTGLTNGETFQCVAYAENRIGRSAASVASASFQPCASLFQCNPAAIYFVAGGAVLAILAGFLVAARLYARRNRVWVTAQVDGGANRPLGWGPRLGVGLDRDDDGWFAAQRPIRKAPIQVRYKGNNRFEVESAAGVRDVHQGDPATVRETAGETHQLILRRYARRTGEEAPTTPTTRTTAAAASVADTGGDVVARLDRAETPGTAEVACSTPDTDWIPADAGSTPEDGGPARA
jgi:hypothetical protein